MADSELERRLGELRHGDHLCLIYEDRAEQMAAVVPFIKGGLAVGECCAYVADDQSPEEVAAALAAAGVDVDREQRRGALRLLTRRDTYFRSGAFDPVAMLDFLREAVGRAVADGFTGLRATAEMTWALDPAVGRDRLIAYEALLNRFYPGSRALGLCQYDRRRFPPAVIHEVLRTHPVAILGKLVCPNPYYVPPELILGGDREAERVEWMIRQLQRLEQDAGDRRRAEAALRESEQRFARFMRHLPGLAWIKDLHGRYVFANDAAEHAFRTPRAELYGKTDGEVFPAATAAQFHENDRRALAGEGGVQVVETLQDEAGVLRSSLVSKFPIPGADGRPALVGGMAIDITDRLRAEERLRFLLEAGGVLASSLDHEATLQSVAKLAVPALADWCAVDVLLEDGSIRRVAVVHPDPAKVELGCELLRRYPLRLDMPEGAVLRSGRSLLQPEITDEMLVAFARDHEHLAILRALNLQSTMVVPLAARGRILGAISLVSDQPGRRYGPDDLALAEILARRAALAIDNARLYKAVQDALRQKEELLAQLDTLQQNAPVGFAFVDRQFRYVRINDALAAMDGSRAAEMVGKPVREAVPELWPRLEPLYRGVLETGRPVTNLEVTGETPAAPGQLRHWLVNYYPVRAHGEVVGLGILVTDITERKLMEEELRQRAERLAEADRLKDEFLAMLAHELRNPLAPIRNALHIMKEPAANGAVAGQVRDMAERQVQHMARLLDDLLDVSRISRGKIELRKEILDVAAAVGRSVEAVRPLIEERRHELTVSLPAGPLRVEADPTRLEQVLTNLLNNAAKYTDPGGHIWLTAERQGGDAVLRVRDTGIGIAAEMLPKVFDLFVQAERRLDRAHGGVGIGLTLVRRLLELHGGAIEASSDGPGRGSEFVVRLPAAPEGAAAVRAGPGGVAAAPPPVKGRRVLVVDDNVDAANSIAMLLRLAGHQVRVAYEGPSALSVAEEFRPHAVLLDIGMPGMDGYEVVRQLRQRPETRSALVVALTGWGQDADRRRSAEAGFDHHFVKPVEPDAVKKLVADLRPPDGG